MHLPQGICRSAVLVAGFWLAAAGQAQTLTPRTAFEVEFATTPDTGHLLLSSSNLVSWAPEGGQIFGDGTTRQLLFPASHGARFFQLESFAVSNLSARLEAIRINRGAPALACAVVLSNRIVAVGAAGTRKVGLATAPVTIYDRWHHGSLTKAMTATLAAMLVEQGVIQWTNNLADVFPTLAPNMNAAWRLATLEQLSANRGGAPNVIQSAQWTALWNFGGIPRDGRRFLTQMITSNAPSSTPGTAYEYSNAGFSMAGHMLETVMNRSWEDLLTERLFRPLGMDSAGFGVPATPRYYDAPWGHNAVVPPTPVEPGTSADNPPGIGPAATVHCSIIDLAKYAAFHLAVHKANTAILTQSSGLKLHTAVPDNAGYALGWNVVNRAWANGDALNHTGSNLQWYSNIWIAPNRDFAVVVSCNWGHNNAFLATDDAVGQMIALFLN
jgi:CubicO group peptidase (beta-lactamase class C family)